MHERELRSLYPDVDVHGRKFDAADEEAIKAVVAEAVEKYGRLDVMFANAGISGTNKPFGEVDAEEFMKIMRTNVLRCVYLSFPFTSALFNRPFQSSQKLTPASPSVFLATKYAAPALQLTSPSKPFPSGSILATASVAGLRSNAGATDYSASKAAVISVMQTTCYQLTGTGVRCNAICPGLIETGMTSPLYEAARKRGSEGKIGPLNPARRGGVADEVSKNQAGSWRLGVMWFMGLRDV